MSEATVFTCPQCKAVWHSPMMRSCPNCSNQMPPDPTDVVREIMALAERHAKETTHPFNHDCVACALCNIALRLAANLSNEEEIKLRQHLCEVSEEAGDLAEENARLKAEVERLTKRYSTDCYIECQCGCHRD